jgi:hypothetical protein
VSRVLVLALAAVVLALLASFRDELANLPKVRVGPLAASVPVGARVRFFALGDAGTGGENQLRVAAAMERACAAGGLDGILLLGDNASPRGVLGSDDPQWQTKVLGPYSTPCLSGATVYPVLGPDDYAERPSAQVLHSTVEPRWHMPNRFYSVTFGSLVTLVAFDSQLSEWCGRETFCTVDFMRATLRRAKTAWSFVMAHHPLASASDHGFGYGGGWRGAVLGPLVCGEADLWLAAHAHHLEHRVRPGCRVQELVSGGGGAELFGVAAGDPSVRFAEAEHGFLILDVGEDAYEARFVAADDRVLYQTRVERQR